MEEKKTIILNVHVYHRELIVSHDKEFAYRRIQDAINDAEDGDTIYVHAGIYYENIYINKPIRLIGENKNTIIIDGGFKTNVINVRANRVIISGFTIRNSGEERTCSGSTKGAGIKISGERCIIKDNIIINNMAGISNEFFGKFKNNQIIGNIIEKNRYGGIEIEGGSGNTIKENKISYNRDGIILIDAISTPFHPSGARENIISNNVIGNNKESNIVLSFAWNNIIENNSFANADTGIMIIYSLNNLIENNSIKNCRGVYIAEGSNNNTVYHNSIKNCDRGIHIRGKSNNNTIYCNKFLNNKENAYDECNNTWDNGKEGNYWSDYHGYDNNNDGIGDIPYYINGGENMDRYPLINCGGCNRKS